MPEIPEIMSRTKELKAELTGQTIQNIEVFQPKCLNVPPATFIHSLTKATIANVSSKGKWILIDTDRGWWLENMGMGGEMLLLTRESLPKKYRLLFDFTNGMTLSINYWWFGYSHFVKKDQIDKHPILSKLGPGALEISRKEFITLIHGQRGRVKSVLLDQSKIAGIGNAYIHDILFLAKIHPLRTSNSLEENEIDSLYSAIHKGLEPSLAKGGAWYELNLYGKPGGFQQKDILIGYRAGTPCPHCGTPIEKIQTGSTTSFICPHCQVFSP